jgi:uncharacterized protein
LLGVLDDLAISRTRLRQSIQTNGMLLTQAWCDFIHEYAINLGVSIDGPAFLHDQHRRDRRGRGTHARVLNGIALLQANNIDFHVIAVITADALDHADAIFDFFLGLGVKRLGFNVEELEGTHSTSSLSQRDAERRLRAFWSRLYAREVESAGKITIREFERARHNIANGPGWRNAAHSLGANSQVAPFAILSVDWQGNVTSFSPELLGVKDSGYNDFICGNILQSDFDDVRNDANFSRMANDIRRGVERCEKSCQYFSLCGGGAPSNKYFENRSFDSAETMHCRTSIQMPIDIVLEDFERRLGLR